MADSLVLAPEKTVVLALDFISAIVDNYTFDGTACVERAAAVCAAARSAGAAVAHVTPGGPVGDPIGPAAMAPHYPGIAPMAGDMVFYKSKIGAFSSTGLDTFLRDAGRDTLVITGVATSGTVLSTSRWAYDLGWYRTVVVSDGCSDPDEQVHRILTEPINPQSWVGLWRIAEIATANEVIQALQGAGK